MSRTIAGKVSMLGHEVSGVYKKVFAAPLILESCQHEIKEDKSLSKAEVWIRTFHGKKNGRTALRRFCTKKGEITLDYK